MKNLFHPYNIMKILQLYIQQGTKLGIFASNFCFLHINFCLLHLWKTFLETNLTICLLLHKIEKIIFFLIII